MEATAANMRCTSKCGPKRLPTQLRHKHSHDPGGSPVARTTNNLQEGAGLGLLLQGGSFLLDFPQCGLMFDHPFPVSFQPRAIISVLCSHATIHESRKLVIGST